MVFLDSNHFFDHVLQELQLYSYLVTKENYCIVFDTSVEYVSEALMENRPWGKGNGTKTAVDKFLEKNKRFEIDKSIQSKLQLTAALDGYLKSNYIRV